MYICTVLAYISLGQAQCKFFESSSKNYYKYGIDAFNVEQDQKYFQEYSTFLNSLYLENSLSKKVEIWLYCKFLCCSIITFLIKFVFSLVDLSNGAPNQANLLK